MVAAVPAVAARAVATSVGCAVWQVAAATSLLHEGASVPFVARYRAHVTGGLEPAQLRSIDAAMREQADVAKRREAIVKALHERDELLLTDKLRAQLDSAPTLRALEAIYEPYKRKRDTLAQRARDAGLGDLATRLWRRELGSDAQFDAALRAVGTASPTEAEQHLVHALAELVALDGGARDAARDAYARDGVVRAKTAPKAAPAEAANFRDYASYESALRRVRGHTWLALHRGAERGALTVTVALGTRGGAAAAARGAGRGGAPDGRPSGRGRGGGGGRGEKEASASALAAVQARVDALRGLPPHSRRAAVLRSAVDDAWTRLLSRAAASSAKRDALERARAEAVGVFEANLAELLRQPPVQLPDAPSAHAPRAVLGIDPGLGHGHKCALVDARTGALRAALTVKALPDGGARGGSGEEVPPPAATVSTLAALIREHGVVLVAVGDGQGSALAQRAVSAAAAAAAAAADGGGGGGGGGASCAVPYTVVAEAGASAYSASELAEKELPSVSVTERGAVSLARRVLDPLSELCKVPPSALGVGLYQKDVSEKLLAERLRATVEDAVADVGVDLNSASAALLASVAGLNARTAAAIRAHVECEGPLSCRSQLGAIKGVGPKAFENAAGFLRVRPPRGAGGAAVPDEPLDCTRVHPEAYAAARRELAAAGVDVRALAAGEPPPPAAAAKLRERAAAVPDAAARAEAQALAALLCDPMLAGDPRARMGQPPTLRERALSLAELGPGARLSGTVRNVTPFGAFVDVGAGVDALLHASRVPPGREGVLHVGARAPMIVLEVDRERKRIGVALDDGGGGGAERGAAPAPGGAGCAAAPPPARAGDSARRGVALAGTKRPLSTSAGRHAEGGRGAGGKPHDARRAAPQGPKRPRQPPPPPPPQYRARAPPSTSTSGGPVGKKRRTDQADQFYDLTTP